jgi:hypothetical protein
LESAAKQRVPPSLEIAAAAAKQVPGIGNEITTRNSGGNSGHRELQRTRRKPQNTARINRSRHTNDGNKKQVPCIGNQQTNKRVSRSNETAAATTSPTVPSNHPYEFCKRRRTQNKKKH